MAYFVRARGALAPLALSVATASFVAMGTLTSPGAFAQATNQTAPATPTPNAAAPAADTGAGMATHSAHRSRMHHAAAAREATSMRPQSVERRIEELKTQLKITGNEEGDWNGVADAMRQNAKDMEQLVSQTRSEGPRDKRTALQDLQTYEKFADAHADGLKRLTSAFGTLYNAMPAEQQHHADQVFRNFERRPPSNRS